MERYLQLGAARFVFFRAKRHLSTPFTECLRLEGNDPSRHKLLGFVIYLQRFWGAERIRRLLFYAVFIGARKIRLMANLIVQSMTKDAVAKTAIRVQANGREIRK